MSSMRRRFPPLPVALGLSVTLSLASTAGSGPLDATDRAAVAVIDARVDAQITAVNDANVGLDGLVAAAELDQREIDVLLDTNEANLRSDLERQLIGLCAERCAKARIKPPASPIGANSASCVGCVPPRLLLPRAAGGYLDDVLALVSADIGLVTAVGLPVDVARASELRDLASAALAAGALESSFAFACMSYGTLSCDWQ